MSSALAMELRLSCTHPSIWDLGLTHYINQWWITVNCTWKSKFQLSFDFDFFFEVQVAVFENAICIMLSISVMIKCFKCYECSQKKQANQWKGSQSPNQIKYQSIAHISTCNITSFRVLQAVSHVLSDTESAQRDLTLAEMRLITILLPIRTYNKDISSCQPREILPWLRWDSLPYSSQSGPTTRTSHHVHGAKRQLEILSQTNGSPLLAQCWCIPPPSTSVHTPSGSHQTEQDNVAHRRCSSAA